MKTSLSKNRFTPRGGILFVAACLAGSPILATAQTAIDEDSPWPRTRSANGNTVTLHLPQVERWTSNSFQARAVVGVKPASTKKESLGVIWFEAHGRVNHSNRVVTLDRMEITKGSFPDSKDNSSNALALVKQLFPGGARTVSLDYLITALGFEQASARQGARGLKHTPPHIIWATNRAALVILDGEPVFRPVPHSNLERVINTPALMLRDPAANRFYLQSGGGQWFTADSLKSSWAFLQNPPAEVAAIAPSTNAPPHADQPQPRIIVSTSPAELIQSDALPDFKPIRGTSLQYAADSDSQLFFDSKNRDAYLLISGRWFKSPSLNGPWAYVAPHDLPDDFAKIPPGSPQAMALASVPGTPQAELALVANSVPTTATVSRRDAKIELKYDGDPKFKPIEGTKMNFAINASAPVIQLGTNYYAVDNAVWFTAANSGGPWEVAMEVPEEIYTIPPSSPVYYATFVRVYSGDTNTVEVGYTPGYTGSYEDEGTTVYGTGYEYEPYYGEDDYYGWGYTWGYDYCYVPWYGWWVWRPSWNDRYGLRAAIADNVYGRWRPNAGVLPAGTAGSDFYSSQWKGYSSEWKGFSSDWKGFTSSSYGYPASYGRFKGASGAAKWSPPANTLALNPYARPTTPIRAGETPKGAQLLANVRQSSGGGRDLYASPDGNIYMRKTDGWYRRQADGKFNYFAPTKGQIQTGQLAGARNAQAARAGQLPAGGGATRIASAPNLSGARAQAFGERAPNVGGEARAAEVANLERQHFARALGQARSQNFRQNFSRPARGGGGGRRR